jgi:glyoxylase-like metal-dependent hydrolase (beta-lactamase superfamily II)
MKEILLDGPIPVNCFLIENGKECYVVDPGFETERVKRFVAEQELEVKGILLTHGHFDHICAINAFDVPVYLHEEEVIIINDNYNNGFAYYNMEKPYDMKDINLVTIKEGHKFQLGDEVIETIHTPGHTLGCLCYKHGNEMYTGDTLFRDTVGRWDFPTGDLETLKKSVVNLIDKTDPNTIIYPAHYGSSTIGREKEYNQFYLDWKRE